jgi:small-conductance mechanosensitive channel
MTLMALTFWLLTAVGGFYMMAVAARTGNSYSGATESHLPSFVIFTHMALAMTGLAVFGLYMGTAEDALAWGALGILVLVAASGLHMFYTWKKDRRGTEAEVARRKERLAEQQIPSPVVLIHGVTAFATILLVLLAALKVGNSP